jgi:glycosyltransferase involved in cell wall biosynthesis
MQPRVLIGVPAYRGAEHIGETLRSIAEQELASFEVSISIDNADRETAIACEPFLSDPRFRMVVHDKRLGWDGNINWLMSQCTAEFFCYWQQDDTATKDYLLSLIAFANANPDVVCTFSDIQWFGDDDTRISCPSQTGSALTRALYFLETMNGVPFRGLIRKTAINRIGPIRRTEFESVHEDFVWLTKLARDGAFARVPGPLYHKRWHQGSVSAKWEARGPEWWRGVWMEFGIGMLEAILPAFAADERETALTVMLERLCCPKDGRKLSYHPGADAPQFAAEFLKAARTRCNLAGGDDAQIIAAVLGANAEALNTRLAGLRNKLEQHGKLELEFQAGGNGTALLEKGWSAPEVWGTWSNGETALLRLPLPSDDRTWDVEFEFVPFADADHPQRVRVHIANDEVASWTFDSGVPCSRELSLSRQADYPVLTFSFPDAASPQQLGKSGDRRALALGLVKTSIAKIGN